MPESRHKLGIIDGGKWIAETILAVVNEKENKLPSFGVVFVALGVAMQILKWLGVPLIWLSSDGLLEWVPAAATAYAILHIFILTPYKRTRILEHKLALLKDRRFEIECGEVTTKRDGIIRTQTTDLSTPGIAKITYAVRAIAFYGFRLINRGAMPSINCQVSLIGIRDKNGVALCNKVAALPFEAKDQGDDLDMVTIHQSVPRTVAVCSVFHDKNEVAAGSGNMKWRHESINPLLKTNDPYDFIIAITDETEMGARETQIEVFRFHWKGNPKDSVIEHLVATDKSKP